MKASELCLHSVLLARPFTGSLLTRIASISRHKKSSKTFFFETAIGGLRGGYKMNNCLMIGSCYVCCLNRELFLHTVKNYSVLLLETNKCRKAFDYLYLFMFALYIDLGMSSLTL